MASPVETLPPPTPKVVQIAVWGGARGPEVLYALRDDGSIWRANVSGQVGLVWLPLPPIVEAAVGLAQPFQGELPVVQAVPPAAPIEEKQW